MPTLNNKLSRAKSSLIQLRDEFSRRAKGLETSFPEESKKLSEQASKLTEIIEENFDQSIQASCNLGDRFEIFNLDQKIYF